MNLYSIFERLNKGIIFLIGFAIIAIEVFTVTVCKRSVSVELLDI